MSTWLKERLLQLHKTTDKTVALVVDKSEVVEGKVEAIKHLSASKDFR